MFRWCYWICIWTMLPNHYATCYFRMSDSWWSKEASCRLVPFAGSPLCELDTLQTLNISLTWRWIQLQKSVDLLYMGFCQFLYKQKNRDNHSTITDICTTTDCVQPTYKWPMPDRKTAEHQMHTCTIATTQVGEAKPQTKVSAEYFHLFPACTSTLQCVV